MLTQTNKTKEYKSQSISDEMAQKKHNKKPNFHFVDTRSTAITQRKLQKLANNSPQVKHQVQLQSIADSYARNHNRPIQKKDNNTGLPDNLKAGIEDLSGYSMDDVKVHYNSDKPAQLNAHAYAQGTDIHIASGQEQHLAHEAWHVVQQKQGRVKPTLQMKGMVNINDDVDLEKEADDMGNIALQYSSVASGLNSIQRKTVNSGDIVQRGGAAVAEGAEENIQAVGHAITGIQGLINEITPEDVQAEYSVAVMSRYPTWGNYLYAKGGHAAIQVSVDFGDQRGTRYIQAGVSATGSIQVEPYFQTIKTREGYNIKRLEKTVDKATCINVLRGIAKEIAIDQPYQERIIINTGTSTNCSLWAAKMAAIAGMDLGTMKMWVLPSPNDLQHSLDNFRNTEGYTLTDSRELEDEAQQINVNVGQVPAPQFDLDSGEITNNLSQEEVDALKEWARALD